MTTPLPAHPDLDWLRKTAKQRLKVLRAASHPARLSEAQLMLAREHGFTSWRALKAYIEDLAPSRTDRRGVFKAARSGDIDSVRRALAAGFDPYLTDDDGRTLHQIAKEQRLDDIEILVRDLQARKLHPQQTTEAIEAICAAASQGDVATLRALLDAHPALIDALGGDFHKYTALHRATCRNQHDALRLLIDRGADVTKRDFPDNATPLHLAAAVGDHETARLLVEAGADVDGFGDDYDVGVLGWATCFREVRAAMADYLLANGARLTLWTAIALDRPDDLRALVARDPSLPGARMSRNLHRRTALHHAAAKNRPAMVRLLIALGADPNASDATGATALTTAAQESSDPVIVTDLLAAGARPDFLTALNLQQYDEAEAMLRAEPARIGPAGHDTIALHLAVAKKNLAAIRWLIARGIDVDAKRPMWDCNHTALHMSIENGVIEIAHLLLDAGADPNIRDDKYQATALGWARFFDRDDFAALISARGGTT